MQMSQINSPYFVNLYGYSTEVTSNRTFKIYKFFEYFDDN